MSKSWVYAILAGVLSVSAIHNVTIDDLDRRVVLTPLEVWFWSNEGTGENNGTFSFSNDGSAAVFFTFTVSATAVYWQGFKRSGAALYSICIDCAGVPNDPSFQPVDGHDANATPNDSVTTLFSKTGLSDTIHNLTIRNNLDPRFPGPSQITLDRFIITTSQNLTPVTTNVASISTSMPAGPSMTALITPAINDPRTMRDNTGITIGTAVACIVASIIAVVALILCLRRRRTRYNQLSGQRGGEGGEILPIADILEITPNASYEETPTTRDPNPNPNPTPTQQHLPISTMTPDLFISQSDIYHMFPAPPRRFPSAHQASDNYPFNHIASNTRPASPQQHHTHSNSESTSLEVPLLLAPKAPQQRSAVTTSSRTISSYIPISISNAFAKSPVSEESDQHSDVEREPMSPGERKRWYPSLLPQDVVEPSRRGLSANPKPEPPPDRYPRDALSAKSMASLRVSGILEATREAMTPDIEKSRFAQETPRPKLSPPLNGKPSSQGVPGHTRSLSSSVFF